jgi:hypothetical protein
MKTTGLTRLYEHAGPFASATVAVAHDDENAAHEHELRVRAATDRLQELGADADAIEALSNRLAERVTEPAPVARTVVVAGGGDVVFDDLIFRRIDDVTAWWGALPDITRWVEHKDGMYPFVLARVDHVGGEVATYTSDVPEPEEVENAGGDTYHVHKVPVGGWSALRYQHETENVWRRNAEAVAEDITKHVRGDGIRLVLLAGDPRSRALVSEMMGGLDATVLQIDQEARAEDGGDARLAQAIREALLEYSVARRLDDTHQLKDRLGQGRGAVTGFRDVADAFVRGQVETLLLDAGAAGETTIRLSEHPGLVLGDIPGEQPLRGDCALIAAAVLTSADVRIAPARTIGGVPVAALLRWDSGNVSGPAT